MYYSFADAISESGDVEVTEERKALISKPALPSWLFGAIPPSSEPTIFKAGGPGPATKGTSRQGKKRAQGSLAGDLSPPPELVTQPAPEEVAEFAPTYLLTSSKLDID